MSFDSLCQKINLLDINRSNYTSTYNIKKQHDDILIDHKVYFDDPKSWDEEHTYILNINLYKWKNLEIGQQLEYNSDFISVSLIRRVRGHRNPYYDTNIPLKGIITAKKIAKDSIQLFLDLSGYSFGDIEFKGTKKFNIK